MNKIDTRDYQFDNIKGVMIILVILCHYLEKFQAGGMLSTPLTKYTIYIASTIPMPLFGFISGYLSRNNTDVRTSIRKAFSGCLVPYLIFNILYSCMEGSLKSALNILTPQWTLWYLLTLFLWKSMMEPLTLLKRPIAIAAALFLALYIGTVSTVGHFLSLSRTFCFFIYYLAGHYATSDMLTKMRTQNKIIPFLLLAAAIFSLCALAYSDVNVYTLYMRDSYEKVGQSTLQGILYRSIVLFDGLAFILFFSSFMPNRRCLISAFGRYSLTIYLLHSGVMRLIAHFKIISISNPIVTVSTGILFSILLCAAFGNKKVSSLLSLVTNKVSQILLA